jgi:3D (Asp-Asp-Asp) domain-containing protein
MKHSSVGQLSVGIFALACLLAVALTVPLATADRGALDQVARSPKLSGPELPSATTGGTLGSALGLDLVKAVVTAYSSTPDQTDETPWLTASCTPTRPGIIALSRDLLRTFTADAPFEFGDMVLVAGVGVFLVEDTMAPRWRNRADIWFPTRLQAQRWGRRNAVLAPVVELDRATDLVAAERLSDLVDVLTP